MLIASFVVFMTTFFAVAQNKNSSTLFLDSDQDGLTDQEEHMIGTDPYNADTDGDGYSDGKEVESGYNPLKPAPGDKIVVGQSSSPADSTQTSTVNSASASAQATDQQNDASQSSQQTVDNPNLASGDPSEGVANSSLSTSDVLNDISSDPSNPNLTNEMIGQLMQLTKDKASSSDSFANDPTFTSDDISQVTQNALQTVDLTKDLPEIKDSDLHILPAVDDKKLSADEIKTEQKKEIEKYLAQSALIFASNAPFPVDKPENLSTSINTESTNLITALANGDTTKIESYAQKAQTGIDQMKKVEVPYILKDIDKSALQLAMYTLSLKDQISLNSADPMKSLAAASSLQAVAEKSTELQSQLTQILNDYGIDTVNFP